ncbi:FISUMP domain-containing protein [Bacteroidota bacterium]
MKNSIKILFSLFIIFACISSCDKVTEYFDKDDTNNGGSSGNHVDNGDGTGILTDKRDDKEYNTVKIGQQWWMAENLNVGTRVLLSDGQSGSTGAEKYCYNDDESYCDIYGGLYNWYTVDDGVCPEGWHVPSEEEWQELEIFIGVPESEARNIRSNRGTNHGGMLKETGLSHWKSPNKDATNSTGFNALPAGSAGVNFQYIGEIAMFWTNDYSGTNAADVRALHFDEGYISKFPYHINIGISVRCVKN